MGSPVNRGQLMKPAEIKSAIPRKYQFIKCVSSGVYGQVVKCLKKDTQEVVAIKLPYFKQDTKEEIRVLHNLMDRGVDQKHIVKFFGAFKTPFGKGMIFEMLEMSVEYQYQHFPLPISDVRTIIKQVAIGLEVLKDMSIMHGDLHAGNVMVSHRNPLHVKITDFGMAMSTTKAKQGMEIRLRGKDHGVIKEEETPYFHGQG